MFIHTNTRVHNDIQNIYTTHSIKDKINDLLKIVSIEKIFVLKNCLPKKFACIEKLLESYFLKISSFALNFFFTCSIFLHVKLFGHFM
jgi:hypothetical protein